MGKGGFRISGRCYSFYVLILLLVAYLLNQLDRYMLAIETTQMGREIEYGDLACLKNLTYDSTAFNNVTCSKVETQMECKAVNNSHGDRVCEWGYDGFGFAYQILAGPVFIVIYTFVGIPFGFGADVYNRKNLLAFSVFFWSAMTLLMGLVKKYWQLAILRFGQGIGQAGCTPFATSIIADYFDQSQRASALGVYNWGIYFGYSMSYALGNFVTQADILGQGWRWAFYISGMPGLLLGPLIFFTMKEPERTGNKESSQSSEEESLLSHLSTSQSLCTKFKKALAPFAQLTLILLVIAGSVRNGAGYVWAYNTQPYYQAIGQSPKQIGTYMSWIPLAGGSVGVLLGGFISDRIIKRVGPHARLLVLVISQIAASPFVAGALFLNPPWAYISLIPGYIIGEMWVSITLAVGLELVPTHSRTSAVAVYLFIISNIGGNMPLLVPPLQRAFSGRGYSKVNSLRASLYILYPGMYLLGAVLFLVTMLSLKRDLRRQRIKAMNTSGLSDQDSPRMNDAIET